jgi:hypothetical protein
MSDRVLHAQRINNGQSEIWLEADPKHIRVVATNAILFPIRTRCQQEDADNFFKSFAAGSAAIPSEVVAVLIADFKLHVD